jgi:hypothetical protein
MEENYDLEIENLKKKINELKNKDSKQNELSKLKKELQVLEFRTKHKGLLKVTNNIEKSTLGLFKGLGKTLKTVGKNLEKSDEYILREKLREAEMNKNNKQIKKKSVFQEAGDID